MSLIGVFSLKGAPGVTTTAMALSATWLGWQRGLVADLDASGGDLGPRFGLATEPPAPGLGTLAAEAQRHGPDPELVWRHAVALTEGVEVLVAPTCPARSHATLRALARTYLEGFRAVGADRDTVVIADFGRLTPGNPALAFAALAEVNVLVARPRVNDLLHVAAVAPELNRSFRGLGLVLAGRGDADVAELKRITGLPLYGVVPQDPVGAGLLVGEPGRWRRVLRRPMVQAMQRVATTVQARLSPERDTAIAGEQAGASSPDVRVLRGGLDPARQGGVARGAGDAGTGPLSAVPTVRAAEVS